MDEYQGQPNYVVAAFLKDIFEPWVRVTAGDEWGEYIEALWNLADSTIRCAQEDKAKIVLDWMCNEIGRAFEEDWWGLYEDYSIAITQARRDYNRTVQYWRNRAIAFKGEEALEETINNLPEWIKPGHNDNQVRLDQLVQLGIRQTQVTLELRTINQQIELLKLEIDADKD